MKSKKPLTLILVLAEHITNESCRTFEANTQFPKSAFNKRKDLLVGKKKTVSQELYVVIQTENKTIIPLRYKTLTNDSRKMLKEIKERKDFSYPPKGCFAFVNKQTFYELARAMNISDKKSLSGIAEILFCENVIFKTIKEDEALLYSDKAEFVLQLLTQKNH